MVDYSSFVEFRISISSYRRNSIIIISLQISRHFRPFSFKSNYLQMTLRSYSRDRMIRIQGNIDDVKHGNNNRKMTSLSKDIYPLTGQGRPNLAPIIVS